MTRKGFAAKTKENIKKFFKSSQGFSLSISLALIGVLFVFIRMKTLEQDYQVNDLNKKINKVNHREKELKAVKAKLLSVEKLRKYAAQNKLKQPGKNQIIIIP